MSHTLHRRGLTLVEVLVVIAVIAMLMGILLPAILTARSAARRSQCANNLKQLGTAVQTYHHRNNSLPAYWGSAKNAPGELFGPWLLHILPELEEQPFYDRFTEAIHNAGTWAETGRWERGAMIAPGIPASSDYNPGTWVFTQTGVVNYTGVSVTVGSWTLVGQTGTPAEGPWYENKWIVTGSQQISAGLHPAFAGVQSLKSLPVLQCGDDGASVPPGTMVTARSGTTWSLTNYLANAHAFMRFGGGRLFGPGGQSAMQATMGGRFPRAGGRAPNGSPVAFNFLISGTTSIVPRSFASIADGLSNTILFGEAMRQCDNGRSYRYAFLPAAEQGDEHTFGIDPSVTEVGSGQWGDTSMGYGNTIMFQQRPPMAGCNKFRTQANHEVMNVAMCDGSVRGISPRVTRREQCDPDVAGREYGRDTYNPEGLGGVGVGTGSTQPNLVPDGIWDMLMVPNDPTGNVLANTGEIGKEK